MAGYTRQSAANMVTGAVIYASDLNAELNALQSAFNGSTGHTHDGSTGNGPQISLTAAVSGILPIANGGTNANSAANARTNLGLAIGSNVQAYDAGLQSISGLTTAANTMIYTTALDAYATTALTPFARTILDDGDAATVRSTLGLATIASSGSASDLTTGTVNDARLPSTQTGKTFSTSVTINGTSQGLEMGSSASNTPFIDFHSGATPVDYDSRIIATGGTGASGGGTLNIIAATLQNNSNTIWTAANDGSGSGLDADLLDGQDSAYYRNATNLNAGTVNAARLPGTMNPTIFNTQVTVTGSAPIIDFVESDNSNNFWRAVVDGGLFGLRYNGAFPGAFQVDSSGNGSFLGALQVGGSPVWTSGNDGAGSGLDADTVDGIQGASLVQTSRTVTAGNGLTGGGALSGNITLTVGTPGTITGSSTNAVTSTSHTHALTLASGDITGALGFTPVTNARTISAGTGLTGGGDLTTNRSFAVSYGTSAGTATQGNDARLPVITGSAPVYGVRAWCNVNVTSGSPVIRASGNVSSITDVGNGSFNVNFTTAMPDVNYATMVTGEITTAYIVGHTESGKTTSSVNVQTYNGGIVAADPITLNVAVIR